jgi:hypothetical protein
VNQTRDKTMLKAHLLALHAGIETTSESSPADHIPKKELPPCNG